MSDGNDKKYMERALDLAALARGNTSPNPLVGALIVHGDKIIGEGFHTEAGKPHAEPAAIDSVRDKKLLKEACMYVTLEPCSHHGRTPPCVERIIREKIPRVVIGTVDTSSKVNGRGIKILREAGVSVTTGVLEKESRELNKRFFTYHEQGRPYIILKWARTADGFIDRIRLDNKTGPNWITGVEERMLVHKWRSEEDAILIGDTTACNDDPALDVRLWAGKNPRRFLLSECAGLPAGLKIFKGEPPAVIFTANKKLGGRKAVYVSIRDRVKVLDEVMEYMHAEEIQSLIIEGGNIVLSQFIEAGLWDEARIFTGNILFEKGLESPRIEGEIVAKENFPSSCLEYLKPGP